jgi:hypothetical protein|tara:strand:- start:263 stop:541 length:279 start_codon:yes stop_codon:yes gene_type:complete
MSNKKRAYYDQPWWKGKTHIMDLNAPIDVGIEEVHDGKVVKKTVDSRPLTADDWGKMHSDAIATTDAKLKADWYAERKKKTTLKRLFKELNK